MQFPLSVPMRALPANAAAWSRAAAAVATRDNHYEACGADVLVNAQSSKFAEALPTMDYVSGVGRQRHLPPNAIIFLLGRLGWVEDRGQPPRGRPRFWPIGGHRGEILDARGRRIPPNGTNGYWVPNRVVGVEDRLWKGDNPDLGVRGKLMLATSRCKGVARAFWESTDRGQWDCGD